jgi:hypothetical protein
MCEFICSVPERYLAGRQLQIAYIKKRMPKLAKLAWQAHYPFNLYNYTYNKAPWNLPYRVLNKIKQLENRQPFIQRNWELQFLGKDNDNHLTNWLFQNKKMDTVIPKKLTSKFYEQFKYKDAVFYSHPVSMLLTLSLFFDEQDT